MQKIIIAFISLLFIFSCTNDSQSGKKDFRIGIATFSHETCTFCPRPTGIEEFEYYGPPLQGDEVLHADSYIRGFVERIHEYGGVQLEGITSPRDAVGGSSGSWITQEAFDKYTLAMQDDIKNNGPYDGIYLSLHGAMAVSGIPKPEAEIVRRLREVAGDIPIIVTLDLHANEDQELSDAATGVIIIKRYPHYDTYHQGARAARLMVNTLRGDYIPVMTTRKPGVITPSVYQGTGVSPAMEIMERARRWEDRVPGVYVSVAFGFAYADVPDVGATVMVITNNDRELAESIADDMSEYIWRVRHEFAGKKLPGPVEGVRLSIQAAKEGKTPVVIADHSDRTGNSSHILAELIRQGAENFCIATITDRRLIEQLEESGAKTGSRVDVMVGGYADEYAGEPVAIQGTLVYFDSYGRYEKAAVIRFGKNNSVIITPELHQVTDTRILGAMGLDINDIDIISLKSRVHFRRGFYENGLAGAIYEVDAPGLGPADLTTIEYENIPKDIYPVYRKD
ncbi:MAG: M81 family metallopeptidase [Bacteroidales bacterium]|jgi:microcystin degradation protein MlrC|nr:M81 family metallopeptidase [Bacteroidales bacterium]